MAQPEVRDLTVRYEGLVAVDGVSLDVDGGEVVGLIGPNGAGKTTLLGALSGFVRPGSGRILFRDRDVTGWHPERRATEGMARTFQRLELFRTMTVLENLLVAAEASFAEVRFIADIAGVSREGEARRLAEDVLEWLGLDGLRDRRAGEIPLGIGRLVEIGRALCSEPSLLLLDEPASGLDDAETDRLAEVLRLLATEDRLGVLLVEHDLDMVMEVSDRVAVMDFGRLLAEGPPEEVRQDPRVRAAYLGREVAGAGDSRG